MKLDQLSEASGIPKSTLSNKLRGLSEFSVSELIAVAIALNVPARDLIGCPAPMGTRDRIAS